LVISSILGVAIAAIVERALPRAVLWSKRSARYASSSVCEIRWSRRWRKWPGFCFWSRRSTWKIALPLNRVEDVLDEDGGVLFQEVWNLSLAQGPNIIRTAIMSQQRQDVICKNIGIGIGSRDSSVLARAHPAEMKPRSAMHIRILQSLHNPLL
jgi:hypothetical protein